jgi:hypothetical protein
MVQDGSDEMVEISRETLAIIADEADQGDFVEDERLQEAVEEAFEVLYSE